MNATAPSEKDTAKAKSIWKTEPFRKRKLGCTSQLSEEMFREGLAVAYTLLNEYEFLPSFDYKLLIRKVLKSSNAPSAIG